MTTPIDDQDDENKPLMEEGEEDASGARGKSGKSGSGSAGGAAFSVQDGKEDAARRKKGDTGEGDSDSWGRGKAGAGAAIGKLSVEKNKQVYGDHKHYDINTVMDAVREFFSELPLRASANLSVAWEKTKNNVKSFAIVNWIVEVGDKAVRDFVRARERTRGADSNGLRRKPNQGYGVKPNMNPMGPTAR